MRSAPRRMGQRRWIWNDSRGDHVLFERLRSQITDPVAGKILSVGADDQPSIDALSSNAGRHFAPNCPEGYARWGCIPSGRA